MVMRQTENQEPGRKGEGDGRERWLMQSTEAEARGSEGISASPTTSKGAEFKPTSTLLQQCSLHPSVFGKTGTAAQSPTKCSTLESPLGKLFPSHLKMSDDSVSPGKMKTTTLQSSPSSKHAGRTASDRNLQKQIQLSDC